MKHLFVVWVLLMSQTLVSQVVLEKKAYEIFDEKGKTSNYQSLYESCLEADIVLFGELHNNPICHWLQLELSKDLLKDSTRKIVFGAEMIETHQQLILDEYIQGVIDYKGLKEGTKLWPNFKTDYKPLVDLAKENQRPFIGTNCPRPMARKVARVGIDSFYVDVNDSIRELIYPRKYEVNYKAPGYKELMEMDFGSGHGVDTKKMVQAQSLKDATMAWFILQNLKENERFIHFNGDFHSHKRGGINYFLNELDKSKKVVIITSVETDYLEFNKKWKKRGDFILLIPSSMTKTY
jgi:uncharacterized iron-regulated protein